MHIENNIDTRKPTPLPLRTWSAAIRDEPEAGGGLMVAAIQLAIMLGAAFGGVLLDHVSIIATFLGGTALLLLASATIAYSRRTSRVVLGSGRCICSAEPIPAD